VIERPDPAVDERRRWRLAEVVADSCEHHGDEPRAIEVGVQLARLVDHHQGMRPDVAFGVPVWLLVAAHERQQLRKDLANHAKIECEPESD